MLLFLHAFPSNICGTYWARRQFYDCKQSTTTARDRTIEHWGNGTSKPVTEINRFTVNLIKFNSLVFEKGNDLLHKLQREVS